MAYNLKRALRNTWLNLRTIVSPLSLATLKGRHFDMEESFLELWARCAPHSMTTIERGYNLFKSVEYLCAAGIEGDVVECGVWKGGSSMLAALSLMRHGRHEDLYLYDTYAGMAEPDPVDVTAREGTMAQHFWRKGRHSQHNTWNFAPLETVRANMESTGYPVDQIHYVQGLVEDTLPGSAHERIALLRLDTDWYQSTKVELETLYPRLVTGGVLILDDYGHWQGARQAVDEYFAETSAHVMLNRIDYACRVLIKP